MAAWPTVSPSNARSGNRPTAKPAAWTAGNPSPEWSRSGSSATAGDDVGTPPASSDPEAAGEAASTGVTAADVVQTDTAGLVLTTLIPISLSRPLVLRDVSSRPKHP